MQGVPTTAAWLGFSANCTTCAASKSDKLLATAGNCCKPQQLHTTNQAPSNTFYALELQRFTYIYDGLTWLSQP
jgi:hypothetical protein